MIGLSSVFRKGKFILLCAAVILAGFPWLLAPLPAQAQTVLTDDQGYAFPLGPPPRRIVSLAPNITEILFALGLGQNIVGVTRYCDFPAEALTKPKVGGLIDPDLEKIRALNPDLAIAFRGNPLPVVQRMRGLGLRVFVLEMGETIDSMFSLLDKVGRVTQRSPEAAALIGQLKARGDAVERALGTASTRPRVFIALQGMGLWTCGRESYLTDLVARAGGTNIAGHVPKRWLNYSREQILEDRPDIFIVLVRALRDFPAAEDWLVGQASLQSLPAIRNHRIYPLDENITSRFGPRLIGALEDLARILHPECFKGTPAHPPRWPASGAGAALR